MPAAIDRCPRSAWAWVRRASPRRGPEGDLPAAQPTVDADRAGGGRERGPPPAEVDGAAAAPGRGHAHRRAELAVVDLHVPVDGRVLAEAQAVEVDALDA